VKLHTATRATLRHSGHSLALLHACTLLLHLTGWEPRALCRVGCASASHRSRQSRFQEAIDFGQRDILLRSSTLSCFCFFLGKTALPLHDAVYRCTMLCFFAIARTFEWLQQFERHMASCRQRMTTYHQYLARCVSGCTLTVLRACCMVYHHHTQRTHSRTCTVPIVA
jgi:hypothetical protein